MSHFLGTTEYMILLTIQRIQPHAYGAAILEELEETTGRAPSSGALSITLDRLAQRGLIASQYEDGGGGRGGRPRRMTTVTPEGRDELLRTHRAFQALLADLGLETS